MGVQSLELGNGISFLKHFIIGHLEHLGFFSSSSGRSSCKSHLIQLCYSSPSSTVEGNCWHKWLFLTGMLLTFLPRICPYRELHCVDILMGFPINHQVLGKTCFWSLLTFATLHPIQFNVATGIMAMPSYCYAAIIPFIPLEWWILRHTVLKAFLFPLTWRAAEYLHRMTVSG